MIKQRPFLKWPGNKFRCIEAILAALPESNRLIEPFAGSGSVFVNTNYASYILAEKNADLIALFNYLKQLGDEFIDYCATFFSSANNCPDRYYQMRQEFNRLTLSEERAALFLYLNRHGYNGLCRYNQQGIYNVPFGRYDKPYFPRKELIHFHYKSKKAKFLNSDFRDTFALAQPGDVIYCDPPYVPLDNRAIFLGYTGQSFNDLDHLALAEFALNSAAKGITVIISNHDTAFTRYHYQKGDIISFSVKRSISCQADQRLYAPELLAIFT